MSTKRVSRKNAIYINKKGTLVRRKASMATVSTTRKRK